MPRRLKLATKEMGNLELLLIYPSPTGEWEGDWESLRGSSFAKLLTFVCEEDVNHALYGWTLPLVKSLGLAPKLALHTLPRVCGQKSGCLYHRPADCSPISKKRPWCFEPAGLEGTAQRVGQEAVRLWGEGVYLVVVTQ